MEPPIAASWSARLKAAEQSFNEQRASLYEAVRRDPTFLAEGITLYDHDILGSNLGVILALLGDEGAAHLAGMPNRTLIDIGCANGDLGFAFEEAGLSVALLDRSHVAERDGSSVRQNAPLVASLIARGRGSRVVVFDEDIDDGFDPGRVVEDFARRRPDLASFDRFGIGVMVGVLYHLKNPYQAIEKLRDLCDHLIVGTWVADCLPDRRTVIEDEQVVFLLADRQLADDPTNFWIFTPRSFRVLVERCGWRILAERQLTNASQDGRGAESRLERVLARVRPPRPPRAVSPPDYVTRRDFLLLERVDR
jgi:tRNA (mo5U34)-methyltransferase